MLGVRHLGAAWVLLGGAMVNSCAPPAEAPVRRTVSLRIRGTPAQASVVVDDEVVGQLDFVSRHGVALPIGPHRLTVEARGYFPWDRAVEAVDGSPPIAFEVALVPIPD
jgi:hypothetical protein